MVPSPNFWVVLDLVSVWGSAARRMVPVRQETKTANIENRIMANPFNKNLNKHYRNLYYHKNVLSTSKTPNSCDLS
jgi:hypothetical protein